MLQTFQFFMATVIFNVQCLEMLVLTRQKLCHPWLFHMVDHLTIMTHFQQWCGIYQGHRRPVQMSGLLRMALPQLMQQDSKGSLNSFHIKEEI